MPTVAAVGDTHVPSREPAVPDRVADEIRAADHAVHAGDFDDPAVPAGVRETAGGDLTAVRGNVAPPSLDLPEAAAVELGGVAFVVTHGTGALAGYRERVGGIVRETTDDPDAVGVCGHTHRVMDEAVDGFGCSTPEAAPGPTRRRRRR